MNQVQSVGLLRANWYSNGKLSILNYGTAFAISDRFILTCTHNIYSERKRTYASEIYFVPGILEGKVEENKQFKVASSHSIWS